MTPTIEEDRLAGVLLGLASDHFCEARREFLAGVQMFDEAGYADAVVQIAHVTAAVAWVDRQVIKLADDFGAGRVQVQLSDTGVAA